MTITNYNHELHVQQGGRLACSVLSICSRGKQGLVGIRYNLASLELLNAGTNTKQDAVCWIARQLAACNPSWEFLRPAS